jgi:DNA invertase Pin-like site-specific DNA recombinase
MGIDVPVNQYGIPIGEYHPKSTISDAIVYQIRELHENHGRSYGQIAIKFHIPECTIKKICRYERRAQIPDRWKRVN